MKQLSGHGISGGVAAGKLVTLLSAQTGVPRETSRTPDEELQRFAQALREGLWELDALQETARTQTSAEAAQIFEIHKMMLQDEDFCTAVRERLKAEAISCEYAVQQTGKQFETLFSAMDDPYMKARSADVRDVASRLLRCLRGGADAAALPDARCIIAAEELTPSQTIRLDREKVAAFVTARGTANSHAAILARTMGIPAVTGVDMASLFAKNGAEAIVDAETGAVFLEPDEQTCTDTIPLCGNSKARAARSSLARRCRFIPLEAEGFACLLTLAAAARLPERCKTGRRESACSAANFSIWAAKMRPASRSSFCNTVRRRNRWTAGW